MGLVLMMELRGITGEVVVVLKAELPELLLVEESDVVLRDE